VGAGTKAGGPNYLLGLGSWSTEASKADAAPGEKVDALLEQAGSASVLSSTDLGFLHRAAASDAAAWADEYGQAKDVSGLTAERNLFRYLPVPVHVRLAEAEPLPSVLRVLSAALLAESGVTVSVPDALAPGITAVLAAFSCSVTVENDAEWLSRVAGMETPPSRIRLLGGDRRALAAALGGRPDCAVYSQPVTESGRVELLPFLHEQAISITAHRFGTPSAIADTEPGRP